MNEDWFSTLLCESSCELVALVRIDASWYVFLVWGGGVDLVSSLMSVFVVLTICYGLDILISTDDLLLLSNKAINSES